LIVLVVIGAVFDSSSNTTQDIDEALDEAAAAAAAKAKLDAAAAEADQIIARYRAGGGAHGGDRGHG
jgi:hypothetical protein